jgi:hypothetical protein
MQNLLLGDVILRLGARTDMNIREGLNEWIFVCGDENEKGKVVENLGYVFRKGVHLLAGRSS